MTKTLIIVATAICIIQSTSNRIFAQMKVLANWRFEQIKHIEGDSLSIATIGEPLTATDRGPSEPQPYVYDNSGNANYLQVRGSRKSPIIFSNDVPGNVKDGNSNTRSLSIKRGELIVNFDKAIAYNDMQKAWSIEASLKCNLLGTEQVFLCKEGAPGQLAGDVSIGYDNTEKRYFVELMCDDGIARRVTAGEEVIAGIWYDIKGTAKYDIKKKQTTIYYEVKPSKQLNFEHSSSLTVKGKAMRSDAET